MNDPEVKHIEMTCPRVKCTVRAFVQVLVFDDADKQAKVDALANKKLDKELKRQHREGEHA